ncbi:unnamed protein product [Phytophthora lilii]|uniref:Unnamed protein product n=1 Tax=Phytophthora lilii TaxID=2077276 RepID=A0A9W6TF57_9STRA|nr:unnamed protein product [Phytophthora lilii]
MAELSFLARLALTLLLLAASLAAYRWLHAPPAPAAPARRAKKRSKRKPAKKPAAVDASSAVATPAVPTPAAAQEEEAASDSDSDDGLSAAQVLATRKFQPKSLGGARLARRMKAALPAADAPKFEADQPVLARFGGGAEWFPAVVLERRKGNEYHLKYDDGELEYRVPAEFIKLRPAKSDDSDSDGEVQAETQKEKRAVQEELADLDVSESDDDDGWQVVGTSSAAKRQARRMQAAAPAEELVDGLTKRQRENRRKKERQREKKEMLRQHAQKDDLDARARWRYVPS